MNRLLQVWIKLALAALGVIALLPGCGNGDSNDFRVRASTTVSVAPITKQQFLKRANAICRHAWSEVLGNYASYSRRHSSELDEKTLFAKSLRATFLPGFDFHAFDRIYDMGAPRSQKKSVESVIGALQRAIEFGQRRIRIDGLAEFATVFQDYNVKAHKYGLDDCLVDATRLLAVQP